MPLEDGEQKYIITSDGEFYSKSLPILLSASVITQYRKRKKEKKYVGASLPKLDGGGGLILNQSQATQKGSIIARYSKGPDIGSQDM